MHVGLCLYMFVRERGERERERERERESTSTYYIRRKNHYYLSGWGTNFVYYIIHMISVFTNNDLLVTVY